jgi:hypothetical protein
MNVTKFVLALAIIGLVGVALADEEARTKIAIEVVDDASDGDVRIELDSDELGFNLHDMQVGENRSIVDKSGKSIFVSRDADGFSFEVDGKTIRMPAFDGRHHGAMWIDGGQGENVDVHVMQGSNFISADRMHGIVIMSDKPIDATTQQAITSLLESAGHGSEVRFINHEGPHVAIPHDGSGPHQVKIVRKHVEVTE